MSPYHAVFPRPILQYIIDHQTIKMYRNLLFYHLQINHHTSFHLSRLRLLSHAFYFEATGHHKTFHQANNTIQYHKFHLPKILLHNNFHRQKLIYLCHLFFHLYTYLHTWLHLAMTPSHSHVIYHQSNLHYSKHH